MDDPIPAEFITLPEAVQRIAAHVLESHLESVKLHIQAWATFLNRIRTGEEQSPIATSDSPKLEGANSDKHARPSQDAVLHWSKRDYAVVELTLALQTGAISGMVRSPESGELFRLTPSDWHFETFCEEIIRGGLIPSYASRGFECHRGRTVLLETPPFEEWLATDVKNWTDLPAGELCREWLILEMLASPNDKKKSKDAWFEQARKKYGLSRREFDRAWSDARNETRSKWGQPGAPNKSSR